MGEYKLTTREIRTIRKVIKEQGLHHGHIAKKVINPDKEYKWPKSRNVQFSMKLGGKSSFYEKELERLYFVLKEDKRLKFLTSHFNYVPKDDFTQLFDKYTNQIKKNYLKENPEAKFELLKGLEKIASQK